MTAWDDVVAAARSITFGLSQPIEWRPSGEVTIGLAVAVVAMDDILRWMREGPADARDIARVLDAALNARLGR